MRASVGGGELGSDAWVFNAADIAMIVSSWLWAEDKATRQTAPSPLGDGRDVWNFEKGYEPPTAC